MRRFGISGMFVVVGLSAVLFAGCGSDSSGDSDSSASSAPSTPAEIEVVASQPSDQKIGEDLRDYLVTNCPEPGEELSAAATGELSPETVEVLERQQQGLQDFCGSVKSIDVEDKQVTVTSTLDGTETKETDLAFCLMVQGSDVADFTPGHKMVSESGETLRTCSARKS